ncbi:hypothetical protein AL064_12240 [Pseudomonas syringae pv. syringae]|nr:hypothetical protein AL064_12240 [Pseudomonas syringae pv. syringae]POD15115.1 hypothetical protein BKM12_24275 [Pseudomonas syringae pv. syringae]
MVGLVNSLGKLVQVVTGLVEDENQPLLVHRSRFEYRSFVEQQLAEEHRGLGARLLHDFFKGCVLFFGQPKGHYAILVGLFGHGFTSIDNNRQ